MKGIVAGALALAACGTPGKWTRTNTALQAAFAATLAVDYWQTAQPGGITDDCREWHPVVGPCGDRGGAAGVVLLSAAVHLAIATALPEKYRLIFQSMSLGVESHQIWANHRAGYGFLGWGRR